MNTHLFTKMKTASLEAGGVQRAISTVSADKYASIENSTKVLSVVVPWEHGKSIYREERQGSHRPCVATFLDFNVSIFKSRVRESIGDLAEGVSIDIYGYDVETDGEGKPIFKTEEINGEEVTSLTLITQDEEGNPLEPQFLMSFRPQWGVDRTKQWYSRLRDQDMLNLVPSKGVPRKSVIIESAEGEEKTSPREKVAWDLLPNLQQFMEKPILNARLAIAEAGLDWDEAIAMEGDDLSAEILMAKYVNTIPVASNAPSKRAEQTATLPTSLTGGGQKTAIVAANMDDDVFASSPED